MKILLIKSNYKLTSVVVLAKKLKERGHDIHILVPREDPHCEKTRDAGITVHALNFLNCNLRTSGNPRLSLVTFNKLIRFLRINSFDVINLNLGAARLFGRAASMFLCRKVIVSTMRGLDTRYERWTNWIDNATVSVSHAVKKFLISKGLPERKITVIHNGIDIEEADSIKEDRFYLHKELGLDPEIKLVGMVGHFYESRRKDHGTFLEAAKIVSRKFEDVRFVLVGSDIHKKNCKKPFEEQAEKLGLRDKVYFLDERSDVLSIMSSLYAHVLPSLGEGCPMALLEAMARKVPNIASRIDAMEEIINNEAKELLFKPADPKTLSESLMSLLDNPDKAKEIGFAGRRRVESTFRAKDMAEKYENLFKQLLEKR